MIKVKLFQNTIMERNGDLYSFEFDEMINDFLVDNGFMYLDVKVPAPINQMVYVKGSTGLYTRYADLDISSTKNVDLKTAQIVLNPLHEILKFELGPVPIMDIRGIGNIDIKVK